MTDDDKSVALLAEPIAWHSDKPAFPDFHSEDETYPWEALPQTIRGAVIEMCKNDNLSVPIAAQAVLSAVSLACQDLILIDRGIDAGYKSVCSLFFLVVADTGSRKSRADQLVVKPIEEYDAARRAAFEEDMVAHELGQATLRRQIRELEKAAGQLLRKFITLPVGGDANAEKLAQKAGEMARTVEQKLAELNRQFIELRAPRLQRVLYSKIPIPQLEQCMAQDWPAAGLFSDEAAGILNSRGESDMASLDHLWDGAPVDVVGGTKQESFSVRDPRLTLSLMVQPVAFDRFLERKGELAKGIGLMSRLLLSRPETAYGSRLFVRPEDRSTVWLDRCNKRVQELLSHSHTSIEDRAENRKTLYFEPDAQQFWEGKYNEIERGMATKGKFENEREFANRVAEHAARLSALFHFFECGDMSKPASTGLAIPKSTVEAAFTVAEWYLNEFRRVFNQETRMREMAGYVLTKFRDMLESVNGGPLGDLPNDVRAVCDVPVQDLRANCSRYGLKKIENFRPVLDWLRARGNVQIREAESRTTSRVPNPPKRKPESVEIKYRVAGDRYEFFFDLDNKWLRPNLR
ncbi:YfjI family protein [Paraburkholderia denitrificans]|uniref:YfjI family protein n=1 Tax=Paraburkholderia denitrificans TaxID=694025 RepID=A0ABW0JEF2_9BURK